ncbi:MAG: maleylpyruvate isomerase family mycothiol-dependent enzyme [Deltaproteobacteria bacterium]|nr:maleylpyruvate isomerase family mycothiol-dependent enzyme [Deltaproteobacteria bacterium]
MSDLFAMIADERRILGDTVDSLTDAQWTAPSAMGGWQIRHVVAHLVWPLEASLAGTLARLVRAGFSFNRMADQQADGEKRPARALAAVLRTRADHRFTPPGMGPEAPLSDIIVHGLDIRRPLGLKRAFPAERTGIVLDHLMRTGNMKFFGTPLGFRFVAEDTGWASRGDGPVVSGTAEALLLSVTGRKMALPELKGDGADPFRAAFTEYR